MRKNPSGRIRRNTVVPVGGEDSSKCLTYIYIYKSMEIDIINENLPSNIAGFIWVYGVFLTIAVENGICWDILAGKLT